MYKQVRKAFGTHAAGAPSLAAGDCPGRRQEGGMRYFHSQRHEEEGGNKRVLLMWMQEHQVLPEEKAGSFNAATPRGPNSECKSF